MFQGEKFMLLRRGLSLSLLVLLCLHAGIAQSDRGTVVGSVTDATGAVIPGAKITVTNTATNVPNTATSTDAGDYTVPNLPAGQYSVRVEKQGFKPALATGLTLSAASTMRQDIKLEVGASQQVVEVAANAELLQ